MAKLAFSPKRIQINKAQATTMGIMAAASILVVFSLFSSKAIFDQSRYTNKVVGQKEDALKQLKANETAATQLVDSYKSFANQDPNSIGGSRDGTGDRDGDNAKLVLDALPSKYDFPALATSLEKLLTGYTIESISGTDDEANVGQDVGDPNPKPVAMPFSITATANYGSVQNLISSFEHSIRPFQVVSLEMTGSDSSIRITVNAQTYYQPEKTLKVGTKVVK